MFDLAKAEEEQLAMENQKVNIIQLISSVIVKVKLKAKEKQLQINEMYPNEKLLIEGDEKRLEQIFINLLDNAIQYTEKGKISILVEKQSNNTLKILISDSGIGIPKEKSNIFSIDFTV